MDVQLRQYWQLLATYLKPLWRQVLLLTFLLFGGIALQLLVPQVIGRFIDATQASGSLTVVFLMAGLYITLTVLQKVVGFFAAYLAETIGWTATNALRADLVVHLLRLDMAFHKTHTPGELIQRIDDDMTALASFFALFLIMIAGNVLLLLGILALLSLSSWWIGLGFTCYCLLIFAVLVRIQKLAVKRFAEARAAKANHYSFLEEHINGTEDIRASGAEGFVQQRLLLLVRRSLEVWRAALMVSNFTAFSTNILKCIGYTGGLALGAYLYLQHQISIGTTFVLVYYIGMLAQPLEGIRTQVQSLQEASTSIERVADLQRLQPEVQEGNCTVLADGPLMVEFAAVTFSYDQQQQVLRDISFALQPGRVLGLLGRTGSGKTTLARLLLRLAGPQSGMIRLNTIALRDLELANLRRHVGMVTQDVQLFKASVRDNLTFFDATITDEHIEAALQELGLWPWVEALPAGLDTELSAGGQGLSTGEAQMLAFARVFLLHPDLVILDEASSHLDPATEHLLEQAVDHLLQDRTGLIIAHRLQTVQRADDILILEEGRIVEYGPRLALASDPTSRFAALLQTGMEEMLV
jgi:ABC-type multidrug transport system fused ATPase/permease subunit